MATPRSAREGRAFVVAARSAGISFYTRIAQALRLIIILRRLTLALVLPSRTIRENQMPTIFARGGTGYLTRGGASNLHVHESGRFKKLPAVLEVLAS